MCQSLSPQPPPQRLWLQQYGAPETHWQYPPWKQFPQQSIQRVACHPFRAQGSVPHESQYPQLHEPLGQSLKPVASLQVTLLPAPQGLVWA